MGGTGKIILGSGERELLHSQGRTAKDKELLISCFGSSTNHRVALDPLHQAQARGSPEAPT